MSRRGTTPAPSRTRSVAQRLAKVPFRGGAPDRGTDNDRDPLRRAQQDGEALKAVEHLAQHERGNRDR